MQIFFSLRGYVTEDASQKVQDGLGVEAIRRVKDVFIDEEIVQRKVN